QPASTTSPVVPSETPTQTPIRGPPASHSPWTGVGVVGAALVALAGLALGIRALVRHRAKITRGLRNGLGAARHGLGAARHWLARLVGWDVPKQAGRARAVNGFAALAGLGFGMGSYLVGTGTLTHALGAGLVAVSASVAARMWRSRRWLPAPPAQGWRASTTLRVAGLVAATAVGVAAGLWLPVGWAASSAWLAHQHGVRDTVKSILAAMVVSAPYAWRYVWQRRTGNRAKGMHVWPRRDAFRSAGLAFVVSAVNNVLQLSTLPVLVGWLSHVLSVSEVTAAMIPAVIAAAIGSAVQRRTTGGQRSWFAAITGLYTIPTRLVLAQLVIANAAADWGDYFGNHWLWAWLVIAGTSSIIGDYLVAWGGRAGQRIYRKWQRRARTTAAKSGFKVLGKGGKQPKADQRGSVTRAAAVARAWLRVQMMGWRNKKRQDWDARGHPDWMVSAMKLDGLLGAIFTYLIVRPMPGLPETPLTIGLRVAGAAVGVAVTWWIRDRAERKLRILGYLSPRSMAWRSRPFLPVQRVHRRIEPWVGKSYRDLLGAFLAFTTATDDDLAGETSNLSGLIERALAKVEHNLADKTESAELAGQVAVLLAGTLRRPAPESAELLALTKVPGLEARAKDTLTEWAKRHEQHARAVWLALLTMASNRAALTGAAARMGGSDAKVAEFLLKLLEELLRPENIAKAKELFQGKDDAETLALLNRAPTVPRYQWGQKLRAALEERKDLRIKFLEDHMLPLQRQRRASMGGAGHTTLERLEADLAIRRYEGQLSSELSRSIDERGLVAAGALLRQRRYSLGPAIEGERARLHEADLNGDRAEVIERLATFRRVDAALNLLHALVRIQQEVDQHRKEKKFWRKALRAAAATPRAERVDRRSLLHTLLAVAGTGDPTTA
ncbi:MAG: hypothetical protein QOI10_4346, partial [Solirubrobacterales bacterium]|nr:hypothetical protein [Solirubrobacterales bacterium]